MLVRPEAMRAQFGEEFARQCYELLVGIRCVGALFDQQSTVRPGQVWEHRSETPRTGMIRSLFVVLEGPSREVDPEVAPGLLEFKVLDMGWVFDDGTMYLLVERRADEAFIVLTLHVPPSAAPWNKAGATRRFPAFWFDVYTRRWDG